MKKFKIYSFLIANIMILLILALRTSQPTMIAAAPDYEQILAQFVHAPESESAMQQSPVNVGEFVQTNIEIDYSNSSTWQQTIHFPDAAYIKVHFQKMELRPGDTVTVSDPEGIYLRTYPGDSFTTDPDDKTGFWALSVLGDTAVITLNTNIIESSTTKDNQLGIHIDKYARGFSENELANFTPESTCGTNQRTDVACYEVSHPTEFNISSAVVRILVNGNSHCTGWRVSPDNFLFTNEHCITSQAELNQMEFWFNYQRPNCLSGDPNTNVVMVTGDQFLIDDTVLDFALVTLDNFAATQSFGYLTLDPRPAVMLEEIYIPQHGAGNPKEFGIESDMDPSGLCQVQHTNATGTGTGTEIGYFCDTIGGSSGSPVLARSTHKVIAIHHFGNGAAPNCQAGGTGSGLNRGVRFEEIWPLVEPYLPPLSTFNLNVTPPSLDICTGNDAIYNISVTEAGSTDPVTLSANGIPAGASHDFSINPVIPTGASILTISNTLSATPGSYNIDISGANVTDTLTSTVILNLAATPPGSTTLVAPADGSSGVSLTPDFEWTAVAEATSYYLEVATDAGFSSVVYTATIDAPSTSHTAGSSLDVDTLYYWRVTSSNGCGSGTASAVFSFSTGTVYCNTPALAIPDDDPNGISDDMVISTSGNITDLNISLDASHTWVGDLVFTLEHVDTGTTATFYDRPGYTGTGFGCQEDNIDVIANDEGTDGDIESQCDTTPPAISGDRVGGDPANSSLLAAFDGEDLSGTWRLTASDNEGGDTGTINEWCIIPVANPVAPAIEVNPDSLSSSQYPDVQVMQTLTISNTGDGDLEWDIYEDGTSSFGGSWADNFDSYATGSQMHGQGGWKGWDNNPAFGALTSDVEALSAPNSVDILGNSDLVHEYSGYTSGQWVYTAWQFIPGSFSGTSYFIMQNTYNDGGPYNWSVQVQIDSASNQLISDNDGATLPLIRDQWVEIRIEIDLDADVQTFYYDDQMLYQKSWVDGVSGGGAVNIGAVDLYANGATSVYYDNMSLARPAATCDGPDPIDWLSTSPISGTVAAMSSTDVDVTFDSTGYAAGVYTGTLCVNSNDPLNPVVSVPLTMTVLQNSVPVAVADAYTTTQNTAVSISAPGVLANDSDGDGHSLTAVLDSDVSSGTLNLDPDGSFTYTPTAGFEGDDMFTYYAHDGLDDSNVVTVTIAVLNTTPVAVSDSYTTTQDTMLSVAAPGVLMNDSDVDGDGLTAVLDATTSNGTLTLNADGSFDYMPDAGFVGEDSFTYHAHDGTEASNSVTVTITVTAGGYTIYLPFVSNN